MISVIDDSVYYFNCAYVLAFDIGGLSQLLPTHSIEQLTFIPL